MKNTLEVVIKNLVKNPDDIRIEEIKDDDKNVVLFKVYSNKSDIGRLIGKGGKIARSIRILAKSLGQNQKMKVNVEFVD